MIEEINFLVSIVGAIICICRMGLMRGKYTKLPIRAQYIIWLTLLIISSISFLYGESATLTQLAFSSGILAYLIIGYPMWKNGPPYYSNTENNYERL